MVLQRVKMDKKGMIGNSIFALIAFSMFIIAIGVIVQEYENGYNVDATNDLGEYSELDELGDLAQEQKESISPNTQDPSQDSESNTFRGGYGIITGVLSSFGLVFGTSGMLQSLAVRFDIPNYIIQGFLIFIVVGLVMAVIAIIFRLNRSKA